MKSPLKNRTLLRRKIEDTYLDKEFRYCAITINPISNEWSFITANDTVASVGDDIIFNIDLTKRVKYWRRNKYCKLVIELAVKASEIVTAWLQKLDHEVYGIYINNDSSLKVEIDPAVDTPIVLLNKGELRAMLSYTYNVVIYVNPVTGEWFTERMPNTVSCSIRLSDYTHYWKANMKSVYEYIPIEHKKANITAAMQKIEMDILGLQYINGREIRKRVLKG